MRNTSYTTPHGIVVTRNVSKANLRGLQHLLRELDRRRGIYLSSGYEYPGRYSRWDIASVCPPLEIVSYDRRVEFRPLNRRGRLIAQLLYPVLAENPHWEEFALVDGALHGRLKPLPALFPEEERSKQPSAFSILRTLTQEFRGERRRATGIGRRFRLRFAVPVRADREATAARRPQRSAPVPLRRHLVTGSQEGAGRAVTYDFAGEGVSTWG